MDRTVFLLIFGAGIASLVLGVSSIFLGSLPAGKLLNSSAAILGLSSILQLKLSGWFDAVIKEFGDESKYPFGPPSVVTRQIIDNPDAPIQTFLRNFLFLDSETGFWIGVSSLLVALIAAWN